MIPLPLFLDVLRREYFRFQERPKIKSVRALVKEVVG